MEKEYAAACRRLSGDWRALERGWALRRRALRCRQRELSTRARAHVRAVDHAAAAVSALFILLANIAERRDGELALWRQLVFFTI